MPRTPQILLPLEGNQLDRFDDFVPGPNRALVLALREFLQSAGGGVFIRGPQGSGKSHLLNASCNLARDQGLQAFYLGLGTVTDSAADSLAGLEALDLVCIDDIDRVAGNPTWENAVFHFFNRMRDNHGRIIVSSSKPLSSLAFGLPDLTSRLGWGLRLRLQPLDDESKAEILQRKAAALGIHIPPDVRRYLLSRSSRNTGALLANLEAVRTAALKSKRRITIPLAREVLADFQQMSEGP